MDKGILLATKTLVESIRHHIRDPSGVFSVYHAVSSIYIWSKNFSHSAYVKSEAKDGGH